MPRESNPSLTVVTYDCMKNGVEFRVVTFGGVITEASLIAKTAIGRDLSWLKNELKKGETYDAKIVEKPVPLWLQNKDFAFEREGVVILNGKDVERDYEVKIEIKNPTKLPEIKGVKFL